MSVTRTAFSRCAVALTFTALCWAPTAGGQDALPTAKELHTRYVDALGGRSALSRHESSYVTGTFSIPAQGIEGTLEVYSAAPTMMRLNVEIPGLGTVRSGSDGETFWTSNPAMGPMILEGTMREQTRQQADFYGQLHPEKYVASAETVERTEFEGQPAYKVKVLTTWDEEYFEFYSVESGLLVGTIRTQESPMGGVEAVSVMSDYRDFGGVMVATNIVQRVMGMEQIMTVDDIVYDAVDPSVFALPDEIKTLLSARKQPQ
jgi:hypothetical protein